MTRRDGRPTRSEPSREWGRTRSDKRARILDAAITGVRARAATTAPASPTSRARPGIAYGLVYHYFRNKEEILASVFEERWGGFLAVVEAIAHGRGQPAPEKLVSVAALILNAFRRRPDWVKVLVLEIQRSSRFAAPGTDAGRRASLRAGRAHRAGGPGGRASCGGTSTRSVACFVFVGALDLVITSMVLGLTRIDGGDDQERRVPRQAADTVVDVFLRGHGAPRAVIEARGLSKRYGDLLAVADVSFTRRPRRGGRLPRPERRRQDHRSCAS